MLTADAAISPRIRKATVPRKGKAMNPEDVLMDLLEGRIPDRADEIAPKAYAEMLVAAIRFHEDRIKEVQWQMECHEHWLNSIQGFMEDDLLQGREPAAEDLMLADLLPDEIASCQEQISAAQSMIALCESELLRLLEKYPELNE